MFFYFRIVWGAKMESWLELVISIASGIISGLIVYIIPVILKKEKKGSTKDKKLIIRVLLVVVIVTAIVWLIFSIDKNKGDVLKPDNHSSQSPSSSAIQPSASEDPVMDNLILKFSGAVQSQSHNAGPGHNTSAVVILKTIEFDDNFSVVTVEVENNGDSNVSVNTNSLYGSTALCVNGVSYKYIKHTGDTIAPGTTETITYYFESCHYYDKDSIQLTMLLGLPLQYNMKDLQKSIK